MKGIVIPCLVATALALPGCSSSSEEKHKLPIDPKTNLLEAEGFVFALGEGSGLSGQEVFRVNAQGKATYVFLGRAEGWRRARFQIDRKIIGELRQLLLDVDFLSLKPVYSRGEIADGVQWCIRVDAAGGTKKVYCDNEFPEPIQRISAFIHEKILKAHQSALNTAGPISDRAASQDSAGLWPGREK